MIVLGIGVGLVALGAGSLGAILASAVLGCRGRGELQRLVGRAAGGRGERVRQQQLVGRAAPRCPLTARFRNRAPARNARSMDRSNSGRGNLYAKGIVAGLRIAAEQLQDGLNRLDAATPKCPHDKALTAKCWDCI